MWPRNDLIQSGGPRSAPTPQPQPGIRRGGQANPEPKSSSSMELLMMLLAVGSLLVAIASFARDLVAG